VNTEHKRCADFVVISFLFHFKLFLLLSKGKKIFSWENIDMHIILNYLFDWEQCFWASICMYAWMHVYMLKQHKIWLFLEMEIKRMKNFIERKRKGKRVNTIYFKGIKPVFHYILLKLWGISFQSYLVLLDFFHPLSSMSLIFSFWIVLLSIASNAGTKSYYLV